MTEKEALQASKYFSEGVSARVWCHHREGFWEVRIDRVGESACFLNIDSLKRAIANSVTTLVITSDVDSRVEFYSDESLMRCIAELQLAVDHIRSVSKDLEWREIPERLADIPEWKRRQDGVRL